MAQISRIVPCLWFDDQAEEAVALYTSIFPRSRIVRTIPYGEAGREVHGREPGSVMTIDFELDGQPFTALNGGPRVRFTEAISLQILCESQDEIDHYWDKLSAGGPPEAQQCGWLKDRFGLSWQVVPTRLPELLADARDERSRRTMKAVLGMKKIDLAALERSYEGAER